MLVHLSLRHVVLLWWCVLGPGTPLETEIIGIVGLRTLASSNHRPPHLYMKRSTLRKWQFIAQLSDIECGPQFIIHVYNWTDQSDTATFSRLYNIPTLPQISDLNFQSLDSSELRHKFMRSPLSFACISDPRVRRWAAPGGITYAQPLRATRNWRL